MKNYALRLVFVAASVAAAPAFAGGSFTYCKAIEQRLATAAADFIKISSDSGMMTVSQSSAPADVYRSTAAKQTRLQSAANRVWDLRAELVNNRCDQASTFIY